jgi:hypothetical protein
MGDKLADFERALMRKAQSGAVGGAQACLGDARRAS